MKIVELKLEEWQRMVRKLKKCIRANRILNQEIEEYNKVAKKHNEKRGK